MRSDRHKKKKINVKRLSASIIVFALVVFCIVLGIKGIAKKINDKPLAEGSPSGETPVAEAPAEEEPQVDPVEDNARFSIACLGDVMAHKTQLDAAYDSSTDTYSFDSCFEYVGSISSSYDLTLANIETTFKGQGPYTGYPGFNTPDSMADAVINTLGVDVACFANNHMIDNGTSILKRGVQMFRDKGLATAGFRMDETEPRYTIVPVSCNDGRTVNVGIVNYTYETPRNGGKRTVQAAILNDEQLSLINHFGYEELEADLAGIKTLMGDCRAAGADVIVCYMHWGEEYQRSGNNWQRQIAEYLAGNGADVIFGSHPHVLQEVESFTVSSGSELIGDREVPVYYSLGNFISNQRQETLDNKYTEQGMIAACNITYNFSEGCVQSVAYGCTPTWVDRYKDGSGKYHYSLIPLSRKLQNQGYYDNNAVFSTSGHKSRVEDAINCVYELIGEEHIDLWEQ